MIKGTIFSLERVSGYNFVVHAFSVLNQLLRGVVFVYKMANVEDAVCLLASEIIREDEEIGPVSDRKHVQD